MSGTFGKAPLCDGTNISTSRAYINNALLVRGLLKDDTQQLKFNSADAPAVMNLVYDLLRKGEQDDADREKMSAKIREIMTENDRVDSIERQHISRIRSLENDIGAQKNHLAHTKDDLKKANQEMKQLRDSLNKTRTALTHTKAQTSNDLRKRDAQIARMKEHLADNGTVRRSKASSSMTTRANTFTTNTGPPTFASYITCDPTSQASLTQESDDQLAAMARTVTTENDQLAELLQATLASLDALVPIEEEDHPLLTSTAQSIIMLEAQLKVRFTALRNILDMPNYVPIEEVESRDVKIRELQRRLLEIESEWKSAQNVLKGLTATVLDKAAAPKDTAILGEWSEPDRNKRPETPGDLEILKQSAKTPIVISLESGRQFKSTVKIDARLLRAEHTSAPCDVMFEIDSTPVRVKKQKVQRKNRRATLGLLTTEADLDAELQEVLADMTGTTIAD